MKTFPLNVLQLIVDSADETVILAQVPQALDQSVRADDPKHVEAAESIQRHEAGRCFEFWCLWIVGHGESYSFERIMVGRRSLEASLSHPTDYSLAPPFQSFV